MGLADDVGGLRRALTKKRGKYLASTREIPVTNPAVMAELDKVVMAGIGRLELKAFGDSRLFETVEKAKDAWKRALRLARRSVPKGAPLLERGAVALWDAAGKIGINVDNPSESHSWLTDAADYAERLPGKLSRGAVFLGVAILGVWLISRRRR